MTAWIRGREEAEVIVARAATSGRDRARRLGRDTAERHRRRDRAVPEYSELLAAAPGSLTGKIAVVTERMPRVMDGASAMAPPIPIRRLGPSEAAKRGAVAYLHRSLGTDNHRLAHTGATNYEAGRHAAFPPRRFPIPMPISSSASPRTARRACISC